MGKKNWKLLYFWGFHSRIGTGRGIHSWPWQLYKSGSGIAQEVDPKRYLGVFSSPFYSVLGIYMRVPQFVEATYPKSNS